MKKMNKNSHDIAGMPTLLFLLFLALWGTQKGNAQQQHIPPTNWLIQASVDKAYRGKYNTRFEHYRKKNNWESTQILLMKQLFPEDGLKQYSVQIIASFQQLYSNEWMKERKQPALSFREHAEAEFSKFIKQQEKIKTGQLKDLYVENPRATLDSIKNKMQPLFLDLTQWALNDYIASLARAMIDADQAVTKEREAMDSIRAKFQETISDSLTFQRQRFQSAVESEYNMEELISSIINTPTDMPLKKITSEEIKEVNRSLFSSLRLKNFLNTSDSTITQERKKEIEEKIGKLNHIQKAHSAMVEADSLFAGNLQRLSPDSKTIFDIVYFEYWSYNNAQQQEIKETKKRIERYLQIRDAFNKLLITLDGKDEKGRNENFNQYEEGRLRDERKKEMNKLLEQFKETYMDWSTFEGIKTKIKVIEDQIAKDPNQSFAQHTL